MFFAHLLLDEIARILYDVNPLEYDLAREDSYDVMTGEVFSAVFSHAPSHEAQIDDAVVELVAQRVNAALNGDSTETIVKKTVVRELAIRMLCAAQAIERDLLNDHDLIILADSMAFDQNGIEVDDVFIHEDESIQKKWMN